MRRFLPALAFFFLLGPSDALSAGPLGLIEELEKGFPESVEIKTDGQKTIEFCPDNTCDFFVASEEVPLEDLNDFAYLYIYYFSGFNALEGWRAQDRPSSLAEKIFTRPRYEGCGSNDGASARCVLRSLSRNGRIKLYAVRYDEGSRNLEEIDIEEAIAVTR